MKDGLFSHESPILLDIHHDHVSLLYPGMLLYHYLIKMTFASWPKSC
jgi:hypothetical protein